MWDMFKFGLLALIALLAATTSHFARDLAYQVHALPILFISAGMALWVLRRAGRPQMAADDGYQDGVVRAGVIATTP